MKADCACIPCIVKQAYNTARRATDDPDLIREILENTADYVKTLDLNQTPADASNYVYEITRLITGNSDPYEAEKKKYNDLCLGLLDDIDARVQQEPDVIYAAARIAILGNVIDLGIGYAFDLDAELERIFKIDLGVDDFSTFRESLGDGGKNILYLGDNCGEIVFDRYFISHLAKNNDVTFVVKRGPIINDAIREDAEYAGITEYAAVIDTGSDGIGVKWTAVSKEFVDAYDAADIILSKGQGNFETMSDRDRNIFFLLRAKCDCVANMLGVNTGEIVFKKGPVMQTADRLC